jgi:5-methylcytosine-specific restriction protein A
MVTGFATQVRAVIQQRSQGFCERDGWNLATEIHHRRCRGMGSTKREATNQPSNGLHLCNACHRFIESHRREALEQGWLVRQHDEPLDVPVLYRGTVVYLDNLGNMHDTPQEAAS